MLRETVVIYYAKQNDKCLVSIFIDFFEHTARHKLFIFSTNNGHETYAEATLSLFSCTFSTTTAKRNVW